MSPVITRIERSGNPGPLEITREIVVNSNVKQLCDTMKTLTAIIGIVVIEIAALRAGHNGLLIGGTIGAIAGLGGYQLAKKKFEAVV